VAIVRTDVSVARIASIIRVTRISELGAIVTVTYKLRILQIRENDILQSHRRINLKFYRALNGRPL
jgi:hypothetical protein